MLPEATGRRCVRVAGAGRSRRQFDVPTVTRPNPPGARMLLPGNRKPYINFYVDKHNASALYVGNLWTLKVTVKLRLFNWTLVVGM